MSFSVFSDTVGRYAYVIPNAGLKPSDTCSSSTTSFGASSVYITGVTSPCVNMSGEAGCEFYAPLNRMTLRNVILGREA